MAAVSTRRDSVRRNLGDLRRLLLAANRRYLEFISAIDDPTNGTKILDKIGQKERVYSCE